MGTGPLSRVKKPWRYHPAHLAPRLKQE